MIVLIPSSIDSGVGIVICSVAIERYDRRDIRTALYAFVSQSGEHPRDVREVAIIRGESPIFVLKINVDVQTIQRYANIAII